jgi:hypothetical protein
MKFPFPPNDGILTKVLVAYSLKGFLTTVAITNVSMTSVCLASSHVGIV